MPDPLTSALAHLQAAADDLTALLEAPYKLTEKQRLRILTEIDRLPKMELRLLPLKKKIPQSPPQRPFG